MALNGYMAKKHLSSPYMVKSNIVAQGLQNHFEMVWLLTTKGGVFFKKLSHSVWPPSLIMSGPDDRTSMKEAVNGKYVIWWDGWTSVGVALGSAEIVGGGKKMMKLLSHPQHNLLRWEERCEAMAEGESIMALLYPSDLRFTGPASPSSTSLCDNKLGGKPWDPRWCNLQWPNCYD